MAEVPSTYPEWATNDVTQTVDNNGVDIDVDNKKEPTPEWKGSGELWKVNLPYPYINYNFNLIDSWVKNLDERAGGTVGDIYQTTASPTIGDLALRFGGTWATRGTQNIGTIVGANIYERIS